MKIRPFIKRQYIAMVMLLCTLCFMPNPVFAAGDLMPDSKPIKVCLPLQEGFTQIDSDGNYSGYNYEYLMHIAQLTGWSYEFYTYEATNENLSHGLELVKSGEFDLIGTMNYSDQLAESYEYSIAYGDSSFALVTNADNQTLNARTLVGYDGLKVATVRSAEKQNAYLADFCLENNINYELIYAESNSQVRQMVIDGLADVMISKDIARNTELKIIVKYNPTPFYFVSQKGNTELISQLNDALRAISISEPGYRTGMHEKYFPMDSGDYLPLTMQEKEYIASAPPIRVAVLGNRAPIQDYDEKTGEFSGIIVDILHEIFRQSGLKLELVNVKDAQEIKEGLDNNRYDVVAGISYIYGQNFASDSHDLLLTAPIFKSPIIRINNLQGTARNPDILVSRSIKTLTDLKDVTYLDDNDKIFRLVNSGEYGEAYVNGYMAQRAAIVGNYPNVSLTVTSYDSYELCLGVTRSNDLRLVNILTQSIASLDDAQIDGIVYRNTNYKVDNSFWSMLRKDPAQIAIPTAIVLAVVLALLLLLFRKTKRLNKLIAQEKNEYKAISQIDRLSKTYNNASFKRMVIDYLADEANQPTGTLIVCDLDNFKYINDTYGHLKGDDVISRLGSILSDIFCDIGIVGRLGGDEFVVLLKNICDANTVERYCIALKKECTSIMDEQVITLSVGAAIFAQRVDFKELFKRADMVLYEVKESGKNAFKISVVDERSNL